MAGFRYPQGDKTEAESIGFFTSLYLGRPVLLVRSESRLVHDRSRLFPFDV